MTQHLATHAILAFCMFLSFAGAAKAEVVQCIGNSGSTTFSDAPCAVEADTVRAAVTKKALAVQAKLSSQTKRFVAAEKARTVASASALTTKRRLPRDDATLQSARLLTAAMDSTSVLERRNTMATLAVYP